MAEMKNRQTRTPGGNSSYKKLAVQWLNEALCPARAGFSGGRQFCASKSPTSCSCKPM